MDPIVKRIGGKLSSLRVATNEVVAVATIDQARLASIDLALLEADLVTEVTLKSPGRSHASLTISRSVQGSRPTIEFVSEKEARAQLTPNEVGIILFYLLRASRDAFAEIGHVHVLDGNGKHPDFVFSCRPDRDALSPHEVRDRLAERTGLAVSAVEIVEEKVICVIGFEQVKDVALEVLLVCRGLVSAATLVSNDRVLSIAPLDSERASLKGRANEDVRPTRPGSRLVVLSLDQLKKLELFLLKAHRDGFAPSERLVAPLPAGKGQIELLFDYGQPGAMTLGR